MQGWTQLVRPKVGTRTNRGKLLLVLLITIVASFGTWIPTTQAAATSITTHVANATAELAPQQQSVVRKLCSNAYLFANISSTGGKGYLRTVHKGRGFRYYFYRDDIYGRRWVFGHSAEAPRVNGWILAYHLCR